MSAGNISQSGASYEAVLIDRVTDVVDDIIDALNDLETAFEGVARPARDVDRAFRTIQNAMQQTATVADRSFRQRFGNALTKIRTAALSVGQAVSSAFNLMAQSFRTAGIALLAFSAIVGGLIAKMLQLSASARETKNRFDIAFGENSPTIQAWSEAFSKATNRALQDVQEFSSSFKLVMSKAGLSTKDAEDAAKQLTETLFDLASFYENFTPEEVHDKMKSSLLGSVQAGEALGLNLRQAALEATALAGGLDMKFSDMTEGVKVALRMVTVIGDAKPAFEDLLNTAGSFANLLVSLRGVATNTFTKVGEILETQLTKPLAKLVETVASLSSSITAIDPTKAAEIAKAVLASVAAAAGFGALLLGLATVFTFIGGAVIAFSTALSGIAATISLLIAVGPAIAAIAITVGALGTALTGVFAVGAFKELFSLKTLTIFKDALVGLFGTIEKSLNGIADAVIAGDWKTVMDVVILTFQVTMDVIGKNIYDTIKRSIIAGFIDAGVAVAGVKKGLIFALQTPLNSAFVSMFGELPSSAPSGGGGGTSASAARASALEELLSGIAPSGGMNNAFEMMTKNWNDMVSGLKKFDPVKVLEKFREAMKALETPTETMNRKLEELGEQIFDLLELPPGSLADGAIAEFEKRSQAAIQKEFDDASKVDKRIGFRSVGGTAGLLAANASQFGTSFDPQAPMLKSQQKTEKNTEKTASNTELTYEEIKKQSKVLTFN